MKNYETAHDLSSHNFSSLFFLVPVISVTLSDTRLLSHVL